MKILLFIVFVAVNIFLMLKLPSGAEKLKYLKIYGLGIPVTFVIALIVMLLLKALGVQPNGEVKDLFFGVILSILTVLMMNIMIIGADYIIDLLLQYQKNHNAANLNRFPVRFLIMHKNAVRTVFKALFSLSSVLMFYGVWLSKN